MNDSDQPRAAVHGSLMDDGFWPNSVSHDQQTGELYPARVVNPTGIRIEGRIRALLQFFEIVGFIVCIGAQLLPLLIGERCVEEAQKAATV